MNGIHDCGGMDGLGPLVIEVDEPVFHAAWERRLFGLNWAIGSQGYWSIDEYRFAMEDRPVADYMADSYYEKWLYGIECLLVEKQVTSAEELTSAQKGVGHITPTGQPSLTVSSVPPLVSNGGSARRTQGKPARFSLGDRVRARNINIPGHTRVPRYIRGKVGEVGICHGVFTFNDTMANSGREEAQPVYSVKFRAGELWGEDIAHPEDSLCIDLWDDHLDPAP